VPTLHIQTKPSRNSPGDHRTTQDDQSSPPPTLCGFSQTGAFFSSQRLEAQKGRLPGKATSVFTDCCAGSTMGSAGDSPQTQLHPRCYTCFLPQSLKAGVLMRIQQNHASTMFKDGEREKVLEDVLSLRSSLKTSLRKLLVLLINCKATTATSQGFLVLLFWLYWNSELGPVLARQVLHLSHASKPFCFQFVFK
jgi:hypothetical protein